VAGSLRAEHARRVVPLGARRGAHLPRRPQGTDPAIDSYSGFFDNGHRKDTGLADFLAEARVDAVWIAGLATDYCVKFTALDARELGLAVTIVVDGCRGVELNPGDVDRAAAEMEAAGCAIATSEDVCGDRG